MFLNDKVTYQLIDFSLIYSFFFIYDCNRTITNKTKAQAFFTDFEMQILFMICFLEMICNLLFFLYYCRPNKQKQKIIQTRLSHAFLTICVVHSNEWSPGREKRIMSITYVWWVSHSYTVQRA